MCNLTNGDPCGHHPAVPMEDAHLPLVTSMTEGCACCAIPWDEGSGHPCPSRPYLCSTDVGKGMGEKGKICSQGTALRSVP